MLSVSSLSRLGTMVFIIRVKFEAYQYAQRQLLLLPYHLDDNCVTWPYGCPWRLDSIVGFILGFRHAPLTTAYLCPHVPKITPLPVAKMFTTPLFALLVAYIASSLANPLNHAASKDNVETKSSPPSQSCFPALDFHKPLFPPKDITHWWCDSSTEYAFLGFSYEVTACKYQWLFVYLSPIELIVSSGQSREQLHREFHDIRHHFKSRYVRLYGACDREGF